MKMVGHDNTRVDLNIFEMDWNILPHLFDDHAQGIQIIFTFNNISKNILESITDNGYKIITCA